MVVKVSGMAEMQEKQTLSYTMLHILDSVSVERKSSPRKGKDVVFILASRLAEKVVPFSM